MTQHLRSICHEMQDLADGIQNFNFISRDKTVKGKKKKKKKKKVVQEQPEGRLDWQRPHHAVDPWGRYGRVDTPGHLTRQKKQN